MAENTISLRLYDFLKAYPPFNLLTKDQLTEIASQIKVQYKRPGDFIFEKGDAPGAYFYVVKEGAILLKDEQLEEGSLVEQCDEGDIFGIRPLLAEENYALTAQVEEETLLLAVPTKPFKELLLKDPKIAYHFTISFAADANPKRTGKGARSLTQKPIFQSDETELVEIQSVEKSKEPVTCKKGTAIKRAAEIMTKHAVGSIIVVNEQYWPIGIATDKDLRTKIATGLVGLDESIEAIMSSPVITIPPEVTMADVQIKMIKNKINHLCITEDGTPASKVIGVVSEHDLLVLRSNNPAILIKEIQRTKNAEGLRQLRLRADRLLEKYLYQEVSISYITTIISEINDALIVRCIALSLKQLAKQGRPNIPVSFCWMSLGSEGRMEQLLKTDQDSALVFADPSPDKMEEVRGFFLDLADLVTKMYNEVGFEFCPAEMMASNPKWCLSLTEWKKQFLSWILEPTPTAVLNSNIFFDYRPVYGDFSLTDQLTQHIFQNLPEPSLFLSHMARHAVANPPPLTFFRNFVVEKSGAHKNEFDVKARAMMPLTDAARLLILWSKVGSINNTFRRFDKLAELEPHNKELFEAAADAYEILIRYRAIQGLKNEDSGRYFNPQDLSKMERLNLRNSFIPIRQLQSLIETRFQLGYIR